MLRFLLCILQCLSFVSARSDTMVASMPRFAVGLANSRRSGSGVGSSDTRFIANIKAKVASKTMTSRQMKTLNLLSGGVAGTVASIVTNPLEVIKTQLQSSNKIGRSPMAVVSRVMQEDGIAGFWRGLPPTLVGIIPSRSVYFYAYQTCKEKLSPYYKDGGPVNSLISGLVAGLAGNTLTNPIWMVRTRMQLLPGAGQKAYAGYRDAIRTIFREEGIGGFYKGIMASYWGCAEGAMQFLIYEQLKTRLLKKENARRAKLNLPPTEELSKLTYFLSAAVSKGTASILTYPHEVARTRLREQSVSGVFKYTGMWQTIGLIGKEEGMAALYSGTGIHLLKVVPNSAMMFLTYEIVNSWLKKFKVVD